LVVVARKLNVQPRNWLGLGCVVVLLALTGCSGGETGSDPRNPDPQNRPTPRSTATAGTAFAPTGQITPTAFLRPTSISDPTVTPVPEPVSEVVERVAADRGVSSAEVEILTFTQETWASTALGCPEPGRSYAQIVTSGYEVLMLVDGDLAIYHVDLSGAAILECERDTGG